MAEKKAPKDSDFRYIVRVSNTDIDGNKKIIDGMRKIKGVSFMVSNALCTSTKVPKNKKFGDITDEEIQKLEEGIKNISELPSWLLNRRKDRETDQPNHLVTTDLKFATETDLRLMKKIKSYRGIRHMTGSPSRGQKTRSNFRRNKGKVMGVAKSKQGKKQ